VEGNLQYETDHEFFGEYDSPEEVDEDLCSLARVFYFVAGEELLEYEDSEKEK